MDGNIHPPPALTTGVFNGDPHPGNILLAPDGRLGLIDYGQTKRISEEVRRAYAKLIVAIDDEDVAEVSRITTADAPEGFGARSVHMDAENGYRLAVFWNDRDTPDVTGGLNLQEFLDDCEARDPAVKVGPGKWL